MPLSNFTDGNTLLASQLNLMVDALNLIEPITDVPAPLFQRRSLDDDTEGTLDTQNRTWRYLILHKAYNTKLYYKYEIHDATSPDIKIYLGTIVAPYDLPTPEGITEGFITLADHTPDIAAGEAYVVKFKVVRGDATYVRLHWLYEGI